MRRCAEFLTTSSLLGGTQVLADHVPEFDATVVTRLSAAGAVLRGKQGNRSANRYCARDQGPGRCRQRAW